ncbi:helix-turn-helix domain-containing protein [Pseudonocardia xishanensis]
MTLSDVQAVSAATLRRLERATGDLAAACLSAMEDGQPWFARLPADQRAGVLLVTQTGVANFVAWLGEPAETSGSETMRLTAEAFRIAPRDLARRLSLRQTVDLVRIATEVFEERLPPLAADDAEYRILVEAVLRFGREIAFAAATVYANAAETRGAWDARQEALVVDGVVRGDTDDALVSRAATLGWDAAAPLRVMVGSPPEDRGDPQKAGVEAAEVLSGMRRHATRVGRSVLVGVQGSRLVLLLTEPRGHPAPDERPPAGERPIAPIVADFGPGPVVVGPVAANLAAAHVSARAALAGLRAAPAWPAAPRPVEADELLPERAVSGDPTALGVLLETVIAPLDAAGGELLRTLATYLEGGGSLEACARALFVHPNTVRYRLRRVSELTGRSATDPRDAHVLRTALLAGRLADPPTGS